jgi:hypothetical protein
MRLSDFIKSLKRDARALGYIDPEIVLVNDTGTTIEYDGMSEDIDTIFIEFGEPSLSGATP